MVKVTLFKNLQFIRRLSITDLSESSSQPMVTEDMIPHITVKYILKNIKKELQKRL